ncbi:hypothetical protein SEA_ZITCH_2 [Gordonia Phage Zitch]|uniref:Uncharacterized protein n=1 Tax=Gordonia Phage Zitch TaxID=2743909 RepID=A0A7G3V951_9CAUD|nr:hypothetical protein J1774_gp02 [Gordonia Phage Zitch]QKY78449.1 hypothetical protein SEA_ZITCH_2 [Gordonia Phage Zitch]
MTTTQNLTMTESDNNYYTAGEMIVAALEDTDRDHPATADEVLEITGELPPVRSAGQILPAHIDDVQARTAAIGRNAGGYYLRRVRSNGRS